MTRLALLMLTVALSWGATAYADVSIGADLYESKGCPGCHTIGGGGGAVGPNLTAEATVPGHDHDWQVRHLLDPAGVVEGSIMPPLVQDPAEAAHLADFLMSLNGIEGETAAPEAAPEVAPAKADAAPVAASEPAPTTVPVDRPEAAVTQVVTEGDGLAGNSGDGEALYQARGCPLCHTMDGEGGDVGPDLSGSGNDPDRDTDWYIAYVMDPASVVPGTRMPAVVQIRQEAVHIAAYLMSRVTGEAPAPQGPNPAAGQHVFAKRGCKTCHSLRGTGGSLGPDLTFEGEVAGHDADWHRRHLANPKSTSPGSTMPRFNLPETERENLIAYLMSLVRLEEDRTLGSALASRFAALGSALEALKGRIETARRNGRNVDDYKATLGGAWTHVGAVEDMIRRELTVGAGDAIGAGEAMATELELALTSFEMDLEKRHMVAGLVIFLIAIGCWLLIKKINLLTLEWNAEVAQREAREEAKKAADRKALPPGDDPP